MFNLTVAELSKMLEDAAQLGIDAQRLGAVVDLTATNIAATIIVDHLKGEETQPLPVYRP